MESKWHHAFNPQTFLKGVDVEKLLQRNDTYAENKIEKLVKPCLYCGGLIAPGLLLNEGSYLCKHCFDRISLVKYPEKYEELRRRYLIAREARNKARQTLIENSLALKLKKIVDIAFLLSFLLYFVHIAFIALTIGIFIIGKLFQKAHANKLKEWDEEYPEPSEPLLRHFHDPAAELSTKDNATLYVFNHWPGYPPFWGYLREVVLNKDGGRCQVSGCPSRLELHIHHIKPVSKGGEHKPENLVSLCDFHHALEPEKGHERIWGEIKNRYFTLVPKHERSNRATSGHHIVRAHLRRLQLITLEELRELTKTYGFSCPQCGNAHIRVTLDSIKNIIGIECPTCSKSVEGPQELSEETGPRLAELLRGTRNHGRWKPRWDVLSERKGTVWWVWKGVQATKVRKKYKEQIELDPSKPVCPKCGAAMRLIRPKLNDTWKPFWGCTQYKVTGCKGSARYVEAQ